MQPDSHFLVNGVESGALPVTDRGMLYGDGLFETIAVRQGEPALWGLHMQRMQMGCKRLKINAPDVSIIENEVRRVSAGESSCVVKIIITRGSGRRGYRPDTEHVATRIVMCLPMPEYPESWYSTGIHATVCSTRLSKNPVLAGMKHLNRLEQVIARSEWGDEFAEGLMLDTDDQVIEGTMSNVFMIYDKTLHTPLLTECGVSGVMRQHILDTAHDLNMQTYIREIALHEVCQADGVFFCNSLTGIWPVHRLRECTWPQHELIDKLNRSIRH